MPAVETVNGLRVPVRNSVLSDNFHNRKLPYKGQPGFRLSVRGRLYHSHLLNDSYGFIFFVLPLLPNLSLSSLWFFIPFIKSFLYIVNIYIMVPHHTYPIGR